MSSQYCSLVRPTGKNCDYTLASCHITSIKIIELSMYAIFVWLYLQPHHSVSIITRLSKQETKSKHIRVYLAGSRGKQITANNTNKEARRYRRNASDSANNDQVLKKHHH